MPCPHNREIWKYSAHRAISPIWKRAWARLWRKRSRSSHRLRIEIWRSHLNKINKANALVGLIRRSFSHLDGKMFKKLFITFVRPHLEYAQAVWQPHLVKHKKIIENVQIRATKLVDGLKELSYEDRLKELDLPTLEFRRARGDMIEAFNHIHRYDKDAISPKFCQRNRPSRKHNFQVIEHRSTDGERGHQFNSFYNHFNRIWNNLPSEVVDAESVDSFKNQLDKHWEDAPLKYATESES